MEKEKEDEIKERDEEKTRKLLSGNINHAEFIQLKSAPCVLQSLIMP